MKKTKINDVLQDSIAQINEFESLGDECLAKDTFNGCLSAIDFYLKAQNKLFEISNDDSIDDGIKHSHFKTNDSTAKIRYLKLTRKISDASQKMADPKIASR